MPRMTSACWACSAAGPERPARNRPGSGPGRKPAPAAHHNEHRRAGRPTQITQSGAALARGPPPRHEAQAGLCARSCAGTGDGTSSTAPADSGLPLPDRGRRRSKGRCPVHQEYMAGRCPVACLSLRWLRAPCAVASAVLLPAGRAACRLLRSLERRA